ncbi:MAG: hypothetical protein AAB633_01805 [Patescibacteria group bacterium]
MAARFTVFDRLEEVWLAGSYTNALADDFCGSRAFRTAARMDWLADGVAVYIPRPPDGCPDPDTIWTPRMVLVVAERGTVIPENCRVEGLPFFREPAAVFPRGQTFWRRKWVAWDDYTPPQPVLRVLGGCSM